MSQFFTKYLPVDEKPRVGDMILWNKQSYAGKEQYEKYFGIYKLEEPIGLGLGQIVIPNNLLDKEQYPYSYDLSLKVGYNISEYDVKKVKLFLCDKDIESGDKLRCYKPDMSEYMECEFIEEVNGLIEGEMIYTYRCKFPEGKVGGALTENFFKVIGEISSDAHFFVKEGDEFKEDDIQIYSEDKFGEPYPKDPKDIFVIYALVKGCCGHFH